MKEVLLMYETENATVVTASADCKDIDDMIFDSEVALPSDR